MTCSKCGLQMLPDQKFCRSCGASLQLITQPLPPAAYFADSEHASPTRPDDASESTNRLLMWGVILMFVGAAIGVVGKKLLYQDIVTVAGVLLALLGMLLTVFPYLSPPRRQKVSSRQSQPESLKPSDESKYLGEASDIDYVPSITERTTGLLKETRSTPEELHTKRDHDS
jgi:zinc-ribbon domain